MEVVAGFPPTCWGRWVSMMELNRLKALLLNSQCPTLRWFRTDSRDCQKMLKTKSSLKTICLHSTSGRKQLSYTPNIIDNYWYSRASVVTRHLIKHSHVCIFQTKRNFSPSYRSEMHKCIIMKNLPTCMCTSKRGSKLHN